MKSLSSVQDRIILVSEPRQGEGVAVTPTGMGDADADSGRPRGTWRPTRRAWRAGKDVLEGSA